LPSRCRPSPERNVMEKAVYGMSEAGHCVRALSAARLGYEPIAETQDDRDRLWYYSMLESVAAMQMMAEGITLEHGGECEICRERYGVERHGIHVEIETPIILLVGHLDRRAIIDGNRYPVEIKCLGRFSHREFEREMFGLFPDYDGQEACYLEAEGKPGLYWVMNRDTGVPLRYTVNDTTGMLARLDGFTPITLASTFEEVLDNLNEVELNVMEGKLVEATCDDRRRRYCRFRYLCETEIEATESTTKEILDAATLYVEGDDEEKQGKDKKRQAVDLLIADAKAKENLRPTRIGGLVSFTYHGQSRKKWLDEKTVRSMATPEILRAAEREGKLFESYTIRRLKGDER